jgi:hypothetical protein
MGARDGRPPGGLSDAPILLLHDGEPKGVEEAGSVSEWREYWTSEEYADARETLTPEELEEELARMRAKAEHSRRAAEMGFDPGEVSLMWVHRMMAMHEEGAS